MFGKGKTLEEMNQRLITIENQMQLMKEKEEKLEKKVEVDSEMLSETRSENLTLQRQNLKIINQLQELRPSLSTYLQKEVNQETQKIIRVIDELKEEFKNGPTPTEISELLDEYLNS